MKKSILITMMLIGVIAAGSVTGCIGVRKGYHTYIMRGMILEVSDKDVYLCIGSYDGAQVGQEYEVFRNIPEGTVSGPRSATAYYKKEKSGAVKIVEIVDVHYARAVVISGIAEKYSVVELERTIN
ncbi:MAG: hypothetical protein EPN93_07705 [Spirochaetes bacterium]|nr:MAG: hypothetical protein EPN93_07705 [Spirochaetota bacterium]